MGGLAKDISSVALLLWPLLGFYFLIRFGPKIFSFISRLSEGSVKAFGVEASAKLAATDAIVRADLKSQPDATTNSGTSFEPPHGTIAQVRRIASLVTDAVSEQDFSGKQVLLGR
jgi:hypothetical protein